MLVANDKYRLRLFEQVRISSERLNKVRNGTSLTNALDQQGTPVKKRFMEYRRLSSGGNIPGTIGRHSSVVKVTDHEETESSHLLDYGVTSRPNLDVIANNRASIRIQPKIEQQLPKNNVKENTIKDETLDYLLKKCPTFNNQSKSVPRLRGLSIEGIRKGPTAYELNKDIMTRIWREEHDTAMSKLNQLQAQQKLQAISDIEDGEKRKKGAALDSPGGMAVKNCFKYQPNGLESNNSEGDMLFRPRSRPYGTNSVLKFRREVSNEAVYPNVKRIVQSLKTFRLGQVAEITTINDIQKVVQKGGPEKRKQKYDYVNNSPKRVQIRFVSSSETRAEENETETKEVALINKNIAAMIPKTKNTVDYSVKVLRENLEFLEKERDITQQKLTLRHKKNLTAEMMVNQKKWPLASKNNSLNNSVHGSDFVDKQLSFGIGASRSSIGETTALIKKYEQYESAKDLGLFQEGTLENKLAKLGSPREFGSSPKMPTCSSKGLTNNTPDADLKPKFQRSMSQI